MGEKLICPKCNKGTLRWLDPYLSDTQTNFYKEGIMKCQKCGIEFKGISGWVKAKAWKGD